LEKKKGRGHSPVGSPVRGEPEFAVLLLEMGKGGNLSKKEGKEAAELVAKGGGGGIFEPGRCSKGGGKKAKEGDVAVGSLPRGNGGGEGFPSRR